MRRGAALLSFYVLPAYSPQLNLVERCWLELKARLLPRRWYGDMDALRAGVEAGLEALAAQVEKGLKTCPLWGTLLLEVGYEHQGTVD